MRSIKLPGSGSSRRRPRVGPPEYVRPFRRPGARTSGVGLRVVARRFRGKAPEPEEKEVPISAVEAEQAVEPPLPPPKAPPKLLSQRTLFLKTPIRTRRGKEVLGAVQALINKLETFGFPVHRYHAARAKELRSADLVAWMRSRGIYTSWTPGETPAANKA